MSETFSKTETARPNRKNNLLFFKGGIHFFLLSYGVGKKLFWEHWELDKF